jgi:hypothetical protein
MTHWRRELTIVTTAIDCGIQCGVVIHLELLIEAEAPVAAHDLMPERVKAVGEVATLFLEQGKAAGISFLMAGGSVETGHLLLGVKNLERQNAEAVGDHSGSFRVERRGGIEFAFAAGGVEQQLVEGLGAVVAALIELIDGALDEGDGHVAGFGGAGFVFFVPERKIGEVLGDEKGFDGIDSVRADEVGFFGQGEMPLRGGAVLHFGEFSGLEHQWKYRAAASLRGNREHGSRMPQRAA